MYDDVFSTTTTSTTTTTTTHRHHPRLTTTTTTATTHTPPPPHTTTPGSWNYPFCLSLVPVMGAIAAGNTVVLKPCNVSSACSRLQAELVREYMDPLVVQVVGTTLKGDRHCTAALLEQRWDKIFFTGSPAVGKVVALGAAQHLTPCTLELGGKNPTFVDKSANISMAAKRTCWGRSG